MPSNRAHLPGGGSSCATPLLPLLLRRESFGGILFDPAVGTHIELDAEGYEFVRGFLCDNRGPVTPGELALTESLRAEIPSLTESPRACRVRKDTPPLRSYKHAAVLATPTLVDIQLTTRCNMRCPHCYASSDPSGEDMPFEDVSRLLDELAELGVCQLALGGGEPLLHPFIVEILEQARALGMVPNLTTSGDGLSPRVLEAMARCCGAVALSLEGVGEAFKFRRRAGFDFFEASLGKLRSHGIPTVFQVTLSVENLARLPSIVDYSLATPGLYGVIFLAYKGVGRGRGFNTPLSALSSKELYPQLRDAFLRLSKHTKVGYDCCLTPGIIGIEEELGAGHREVLEGCSAARGSVGITTGMEVVPCTFAAHRPLGNLREKSLAEIWRGDAAEAFRRRLDGLGDTREACRGCPSRNSCLGGCPEWDLVRCTA